MLSDYDKAVRLDPKDAIALCAQSTYAVTARYHEAIADYTAVIALDGRCVVALSARSNEPDESGDHLKSIEDLSRAIELDHNFSRAYCASGRRICENRDFDRASLTSTRH